MRFIHRAGLALITATLAATAACSDNVAPPPPPPAVFDGAQARAQIDPLAAVLDQPIVTAFHGAISYYIAILRGASVGGTASTAPAAPMPLGFSRSLTSLDLSRSLTPIAPLASLGAVSIPAKYAGKTFVFDPAVNFYVVDSAATDAPADGVRFVLYTFDETGYPDEPLTRLGYLDITPAANGADGVHLVVVRDAPQLTVADVERTRTAITGGESFRLDGYVTDGTTTMDIALDGSNVGTGQQQKFVYDSKLSSASLGVGMEIHFNFDATTPTLTTGGFIVTYGGHTFESVSMPPTGGELRFDGQLYARVVYSTTTGGASAYVKPDGTSLSQAEINDLLDLFSRVGPASFFWVNLAFP